MRLALLESLGWPRVSSAFRAGESGIDFSDVITGFPRDVDLQPLRNVLDHAMATTDGGPVESDRWLAPRVHAALRLTPREAADRRLWAYLGAVVAPDYVRWRFSDNAPRARYVGRDDTQALSRLWWGSELTRNGSDYGPTVLAFSMQDVPNQWQRLDAFHNRALAVAAVQFLAQFRDGQLATSDQVVALSRALNHVLTTVVLDRVACGASGSVSAWDEWLAEPVDETLFLEEFPEGPNEDPVSDADITSMRAFLSELAAEIQLQEVRRARGAADGL